MKPVNLNEIECMVDAHGLAALVEALADVADRKADHIREAWGDKATAGVWQRCARRLHSAHERIEDVFGR